MILKEAIERINESIEEIISSYVELTPAGNKLMACCPLHGEKTPSFVVTPHKSMFKCFGCQKGGDALNFIMEHDSIPFIDAVKRGAELLKLEIEWNKQTDADREEYKQLEAIRIVNEMAVDFFREQLQANEVALKYVEEREFELSDDEPIAIGYAPEGNLLLKWAREKQIKLDLLIRAGLIREKNGHYYDFFRHRIMFTIRNYAGKTIGFTGRDLNQKSEYKYLNTPETELFVKGKELFGLSEAIPHIRKENRAYLIEGNFDVKRLHDIKVKNSVAPCGTSLTPEQAKLLKKYTNNVTLIYDGDNAGSKAILRNGEILVKQKFNVSVVLLPADQDPDTFFKYDPEKDAEFEDKGQDYLGADDLTKAYYQFERFKDDNTLDFILYLANLNVYRCKNPAFKSEFIKHLCHLIAQYDETVLHNVYIDQISEVIKPKKAWQDQLSIYMSDKTPTVKKSTIPADVSLSEFNERGFYVQNNCYYFTDGKGSSNQKSNFVVRPLFHIESTINAKRLFELTNVSGIVRVIEIAQKDLVAIMAFKIKVESLGNFLWTGAESDLNRLKAWLYENQTSAIEIIQMGWQKQGFFAWGNGLISPQSEFLEVDEYGIVEYEKQNYYIPAFSKIYKSEDSLYQFERKFIHIEGNITLNEYVRKFCTVYGDTGKIALCFYFASLFRDVITSRFGFFPILNLFGQKGAGKTECAHSLMHLFGPLPKGPNMNSITKASIGDHLASASNAICHLDEYRNDLEMEKRELLKNIWDIRGRTRKNMDKDKKNETTAVDQALIITGQQMPTADVALFTRVIFLCFTQSEFTEQEKKRYTDLKEVEKRGLTHITNSIMRYRGEVKDTYQNHVKKVSERMTDMLKGEIIEDRIFNNWMVVMAAYSCLSDHVELFWDYDDTLRTAVKLMKIQNAEIKASDDLGHFWKIFEYLCSSNLLFNDMDYKIVGPTTTAKRRFMKDGQRMWEELQFKDPKHLLYLTTNRVFSLYKKQCIIEGDKPMPEATIEYYLKNSKAFLFSTHNENFKKIDVRTGLQEKDDKGNSKRTSTTAICFDLSLISISISTHIDDEVEQSSEKKGDGTTEPKAQTNIPFNEQNIEPF